MSLKRIKFLAILSAVGILLSVAATLLLLVRFERHLFSSPKYGLGKIEIGRQTNSQEPKPWQDLSSLQRKRSRTSDQKQIPATHNESDFENPLPASEDDTLALLPLTPSTSETNEKDLYFELMTEALEDDFPELDLSEIERIELFEAIWTVRKSFERTRSLDRSAENADAIHQSELERDAAIKDFENIVGMSFSEFMLRAPSTDGGIDHD